MDTREAHAGGAEVTAHPSPGDDGSALTRVARGSIGPDRSRASWEADRRGRAAPHCGDRDETRPHPTPCVGPSRMVALVLVLTSWMVPAWSVVRPLSARLSLPFSLPFSLPLPLPLPLPTHHDAYWLLSCPALTQFGPNSWPAERWSDPGATNSYFPYSPYFPYSRILRTRRTLRIRGCRDPSSSAFLRPPPFIHACHAVPCIGELRERAGPGRRIRAPGAVSRSH
jgi:hypothetical protein